MIKELPKNYGEFSELWTSDSPGFLVLSDKLISGSEEGLCQIVIEVPEGPCKGIWISSYTCGRDTCSMTQLLRWYRAKMVTSTEWVVDIDEHYGKPES